MGLLSWAAGGQAAQPTNLLRNGSFEGGLLYWHNIDPKVQRLVRGNTPVGEYALRIEKGNPMSAPFVAESGREFSVSFFVKGDRPGTVEVQLAPSARENAVNAKRLWVAGAEHAAQIGTNWQRVSFTAKADVPQDGFWALPHYLVQISGNVPLEVDGVCVTTGTAIPATYVPRRPVEVLAECPDLHGYEVDGNLIGKSESVRVIAHVSNPGESTRDLTVRWQWIDYEGERPVGDFVEKRIALEPGRTVSETATLKLSATGCVLARVSVLDGSNIIDSSDLPLTSLPYSMGPRKPDARERFGGSFFGPGSARRGSQIGFGWSRWFPHTKWQDHQPDGPESWHWFDKEVDYLESLGISTHLVLYGWPKWIMEEGGNPLPKDMRWPAADPRWEDLKVETAWDRYLKKAAEHYQGRAVVYEIENEPEFDHWDKMEDQYAKFTIRSARLIKQIDPSAKVMINNVYGIPSGLNRRFLELGGGKYIDIISWHDYHAGWLTDATAIKRMRSALDELGGKHIEIWFNEGWAFSNTAVDEPLACTTLDAAQAANAMVCSVAEVTANGQEKTILFHTGYEEHGMSFWDYSGPGTMLWDWYGYPMPLVAAWNTLSHHLGLSERVAFIRPLGANFCVFQDLRNSRGVIVAYADREAKTDVAINLPFDNLISEDAMGNSSPLRDGKIVLRKSGRPVFLYASSKTPGKVFAEKLEPMDRRHASFVSTSSSVLPQTWNGKTKGSTNGNPAVAEGKPVWGLQQVYPPDPKNPASYHPLVWGDNYWVPLSDAFGGQPKVEMVDRGIRLEFRAAHGQPPAERICGLSFFAPKDGVFSITGFAHLKMWEGDNAVRLTLIHKTGSAIRELASLKLAKNQEAALSGFTATVAAGEELILLPRIEGAFNGGDITLRDLEIRSGSHAEWRLPNTWGGRTTGTADGNPIVVQGKPVWRLDQLWPDDPIMAANYLPLTWSGANWGVKEHGQGGQPAVVVADGAFDAAVRGPWAGPDMNRQRVAGLVFAAPQSGVYHITGNAKAKPWEGGAKVFHLSIRKKDTQRAAEMALLELPRDGTAIPMDFRFDLTAGHELIFLPLMPDWHNGAHISLENLVIKIEPGTQ